MISVVNGNALHIPLADGCVQCAVTSPPYYGLRDYGIDGQLGLEPTPEAYVANLVAVFREVWRVLRDDGTAWINLGDSYFAQQGKGFPGTGQVNLDEPSRNAIKGIKRPEWLKPKDLLGIPWRVAFALQADGWYLRSDIIWHKPNPMPESVTDRPTKSHEYIFLLSKSQRYYYDAEAVREDGVCDDPREIQSGLERARQFGYDTKEFQLRPPRKNDGQDNGGNGSKIKDHVGNSLTRPDRTRNRRTVWTIATSPYSGAHFATFPPALVEPCILAGTSERGQCPTCGAPWVRVVERVAATSKPCPKTDSLYHAQGGNGAKKTGTIGMSGGGRVDGFTTTTGWRQSCACPPAEPVPQLVLDPFAGTATVGRVCARLRRNFVGIELNPAYITLARKRTSGVQIEMAGATG